jgi:hypothetical protein
VRQPGEEVQRLEIQHRELPEKVDDKGAARLQVRQPAQLPGDDAPDHVHLIGDDPGYQVLGEFQDQVAEEQVLVRPAAVSAAARHVGLADDVLEADVLQAHGQPGPVHHGERRRQHPPLGLVLG